MFRLLDFDNVETYTQSGNVVFTAFSKKESEIEKEIQGGILITLGFKDNVFLCTRSYQRFDISKVFQR